MKLELSFLCIPRGWKVLFLYKNIFFGTFWFKGFTKVGFLNEIKPNAVKSNKNWKGAKFCSKAKSVLGLIKWILLYQNEFTSIAVFLVFFWGLGEESIRKMGKLNDENDGVSRIQWILVVFPLPSRSHLRRKSRKKFFSPFDVEVASFSCEELKWELLNAKQPPHTNENFLKYSGFVCMNIFLLSRLKKFFRRSN